VDGKTPVAHFTLSPNPANVGETVNYDGSSSYDPDGSITGYAWLFESHTPSSGTVVSGTLNYASAGTYNIQLIVTDGTGVKSLPARVALVVTPPDIPTFIGASDGSGVFYNGGTIDWVDKNVGLSPDKDLVHDMAIDPATHLQAVANKVLWIATSGGMLSSNDGGATWTEQNPSGVLNQWGDSPAPGVSDLTFTGVRFAGTYLFCTATWVNAGTLYRSWLYRSNDYQSARTGGAITWSEVTTGWDA